MPFYIGIAIIECQGHTLSLQRKETVIFNMDVSPDQAAQYEDPKVARYFHSLGIC